MTKSSYLERWLGSFFREQIVTGFRNVTEKKVLPFATVSACIIIANLLAMVLYWRGENLPLEFVKQLNSTSLVVASSLIFFGLLSAVRKKKRFQSRLVALGMITSTAWALVYGPATSPGFFQNLKLFFLGSWTVISSLSVFFLVFYFFTGLVGKAVTAGKSSEHVFLKPIIRLGALATVLLSIWLAIENPTTTMIGLGAFGAVAGTTLLVYIWAAEPDETNANFITIIGIYNLYVAYQLSGSIRASNQTTMIITEAVLLVLIALYSMQGMVSRAKSIDSSRLEERESGRRVFFQERFVFFAKIKRVFGDFSLVLVALGFSLGYSLFMLSMYLDPSVPMLEGFLGTQPSVPVFSHRLFALTGLVVFFVMFAAFHGSTRFREFATNKYTIQHGVRVAEDRLASLAKQVKKSVSDFLEKNRPKKNEEKKNNALTPRNE